MNVLFNKWFAGGLIVLIVLSGAILYPKDFKQMLSDNPNAKYVVTYDVLSQQGNVISPDAKAGYLRWKFSKSEYDSYYWGSLKEMDATWAVEYKNSSGIWIELPRKSSTVKLNYSENIDSVSIIKEWGIYKYPSKSGTAGKLIENISVFPGRVKFSAKFIPADARDYRLVWKFKGIKNQGNANVSETDYWFSSQYPSKHKGWYANVVRIDEPEKLDFMRGTNVSADFVMKAGELDIDPTVTLQTAETENLEDTWVYTFEPNTNFGSDPDMYISTGGDQYFAYLKFNLSSIPSNSIMTSAILSLYSSPSGGGNIKLASRCLKNNTWGEHSVTYNYRPGGLNTTIESFNVTKVAIEGDLWVNFSAGTCVNQSAALYSFTNVSFQLTNASSTPSGFEVDLFSKEAETAYRPILYVTYTFGDTAPPQHSLNRTNFTSTNFPAWYQFNTTWSDNYNVNTVFFEGNFSGTMQNISATGNQSSEYYLNYYGAIAGDHIWRSIANDTNNNWNATSWMNFTVSPTLDNTFPLFSLNQTNFTSTTYPAGYQFNVTWTDDVAIGIVLLEGNFSGNFSNYTVSTFTGAEYYFNIGPVSGGDHAWRMIGNDTSGNTNATSWMNFTVGNGTLNALTFLNATPGNISGIYPSTIIASGNTTSEGALPAFNLFILNGTNASAASTSGAGNISLTVILGAGTHAVVYNFSGNLNWSSVENRTLFIIVNKSTAQNAVMYLNGTQLGRSYFHDQYWNMTLSCNDPIAATLSLNATGYGNGFASGIAPLTNISKANLYHSESNYNITGTCADNGNYSASSIAYTMNIDPGFDLYLNASLQFTPFLNTQYNVEPTYQSANRPAVCANNTRIGTTINISFYTKANYTALYNVTMFAGTAYSPSLATKIGMWGNESWLLTNIPANQPSCLYFWINITKGKAGTWIPSLFSDARLS